MEVRLATSRDLTISESKVFLHLFKGILEEGLRGFVDLVDRLDQFVLRVPEVFALAFKEVVALFQVRVFTDRVEIDGAHIGDAPL